MDLLRASDSIDALIERRVREKSNANELEEMYAESARRHRERIRREHAALWYEYEMCLAQNHRQLSEEHEARALALLEEPGGEGVRT